MGKKRDREPVEHPPLSQPEPVADDKPLRLIAAGLVLILVASITIGSLLFIRYGRDTVFALRAETPQKCHTEARDAMHAGKTNEAIRLYKRALAAPFQDNALKKQYTVELIDLLIRSGHQYEAADYLEDAIEAEQSDLSLFPRLVRCRYDMGQYELAQQAVDFWIQEANRQGQQKDLAHAYYYSALLMKQDGRNGAALTRFTESVALDPASDSVFEAVPLLIKDQRRDAAIRILEGYIKAVDNKGKQRRAQRELKKLQANSPKTK